LEMNNLISSGKHADIFNSDQNKQIPAMQKMADFIDNPDLVSYEEFK